MNDTKEHASTLLTLSLISVSVVAGVFIWALNQSSFFNHAPKPVYTPSVIDPETVRSARIRIPEVITPVQRQLSDEPVTFLADKPAHTDHPPPGLDTVGNTDAKQQTSLKPDLIPEGANEPFSTENTYTGATQQSIIMDEKAVATPASTDTSTEQTADTATHSADGKPTDIDNTDATPITQADSSTQPETLMAQAGVAGSDAPVAATNSPVGNIAEESEAMTPESVINTGKTTQPVEKEPQQNSTGDTDTDKTNETGQPPSPPTPVQIATTVPGITPVTVQKTETSLPLQAQISNTEATLDTPSSPDTSSETAPSIQGGPVTIQPTPEASLPEVPQDQSTRQRNGWIYAGQYINGQWLKRSLELPDTQLPDTGATYKLIWATNVRAAPPGKRKQNGDNLAENIDYLAAAHEIEIKRIKNSGKTGHIWLEINY